MALLKIFVSSTCYDLGMVRSELRNFIIGLGHEPVMSEYDDILYNPADHTHISCLKEIPNCDIVILIVGARFGGKAINEAVKTVDVEKLKLASKSKKMLDNWENLSITQLEILKAIESNIPIFTFVDSKVLNDHLFYEKNKDKGIIDQIDFPAIDNKKAAVYIFEFINFLRLRSTNNAIANFDKISDIQTTLKKQWSSLLQSLLNDEKSHKNERKRIEFLSEELKDIKSLIMTSMPSDVTRQIAKGVIRFRRLIDLFFNLQNVDIQNILMKDIDWTDLLLEFDIIEIQVTDIKKSYRPTVLLVKTDRTYYEYRLNLETLSKIANDWNLFRSKTDQVKSEIISAIIESDTRSMPLLRYFNENINDVLSKTSNSDTNDGLTTTTLSPSTIEQAMEGDDGYSVTSNDRT